MNFCTDSDLLLIEPRLFEIAARVATTTLTGIGQVVDAYLSFISRTPSDVIPQAGDVLTFLLPAEYPVICNGGDDTGTVIVLPSPQHYQQQLSSPVLSQETNLSFIVRTFTQRATVNDQIASALSLLSSQPVPTVLNPQALRRPAAIITLGMIYRSLAHNDRTFSEPPSGQISVPSPTHWRRAAEYYEQLSRGSLQQARVELDTDGDGKPNIVKRLSEVLLVRR